jgi:hypothetical protein
LTHRDALATPKRVRKNGETNPVTVLLIVALVAISFYVFHVGPLYWDNLEAKEAAAEAFNVFYTDGEDLARTKLLTRLNIRSTNTEHYEVDEEGVETIKPGYGLQDENIAFIYDEETKQLTVRITYDRIVEFKPFKKRKTYHLVAEKVGKRAS